MVQHMQHPSSIDSSATVETKAEQGDQYVYLQALQALRMRLRGELVLPENLEYESARTVWNGGADCHPALIVRCVDAGDVAASVTFAKEQGPALPVRSGGHSPAGYGTNDGGIVIAPLRQLGTIVADVISPIPYPVMFAFTEEASKHGFPQYARSLFASRLSDELVQTLVTQKSSVISLETMVQIRILGGAMRRVPIAATAFAHRDKQVSVSDLPELQSFATGVKKDKAAVRAGLTWSINNGWSKGM